MGSSDMPGLRAKNLARVLNPRSIALIGATPRAGSFSARTLANLAEFRGELFLVNEKYDTIDGRPCHPSLASLPVAVDSAIIALPASMVQTAVTACIQASVGGAVVYASGYAEMGDQENRRRQQHLAALAADSGMRLVGPNCMGVINYASQAIQSFQQFPRTVHDNGRAIGLVSQSGALALALSQATQRGVSFSHILTFGNGADVDLSDLVEYLASDPACHVIACLFEGLSQPGKLLRAAASARRAGKPLVVCKLATGAEGAKAALSHTGTLAGSHNLYRAFLEREGVIWIDRFDALLDIASFFAKAPPCRASGIGIVAASGGAGIMAVDKAEAYGLALPQPSPETRATLAANMPSFGSPNNPCDVTAEVVNQPQSLAACMHAMARDDAYGALIVAHTVAGSTFTPRLEIYADAARTHRKPVCAVWLSEWKSGPGAADFEQNADVMAFGSMDNCLLALQRWQWHAAQREQGAFGESQIPMAHNDAPLVRQQLLAHPAGATLDEHASKAVLHSYGIDTNREMLVSTPAQAIKAAEQIGYPVVLKVVSPDLPHKTEAGGVALGIADARQLEQAFQQMQHDLSRLPDRPRIHGFLVQEMVGKGLELIVGARVDPQFGPYVVVGHGGILVELLKQVAIAPAPVSPMQARQLIATLPGQALFDGFRGDAPVDRDRLADTISRISHLATDQAAHFTELDVNPLICRQERIVAVDALLVRAP